MWLRRLFGMREKSYWLRIPLEEEFEHVLLLGDSGTGKSQIIHSFLLQIARRRPAEAAIIYDPACEFVERHFNARRGDLILNPLDARSPYWSLSGEVRYPTDRQLIAEAFFPGKEDSRYPAAPFFTNASRSIFGRMLEFRPTPQEMIKWLQDARYVDELVRGTEHAHYIDPKAGNQRGGVLASLAEIGGALKLLPTKFDCPGEIILTEWAKRRRGWLFITSTKETRPALRPLQTAFIDILLKRLMSVSPECGRASPCWLVIDEVHSLRRLPALPEALYEGRKYGLKIVQGTQGRSQYEGNFGAQSEAMLAAAHLKIFLRHNEPKAAQWVADSIGEEELEKQRIGTTASASDRSRHSINYTTQTERRASVSKEEVMALPNLNGYWKYEDRVVGFRLKYQWLPKVVEGTKRRPIAEEASPPVRNDPEPKGEEQVTETFTTTRRKSKRGARGSEEAASSEVTGVVHKEDPAVAEASAGRAAGPERKGLHLIHSTSSSSLQNAVKSSPHDTEDAGLAEAEAVDRVTLREQVKIDAQAGERVPSKSPDGTGEAPSRPAADEAERHVRNIQQDYFN